MKQGQTKEKSLKKKVKTMKRHELSYKVQSFPFGTKSEVILILQIMWFKLCDPRVNKMQHQ